jgi:predicted cupin superfamily sugar epimerase
MGGRDARDEAAAVIAALGLTPHPEGGHFRETWRDAPPSGVGRDSPPRGAWRDPTWPGGRGHGTAIYYLLRDGERSHWHRVDAVEVWHHYAGAPLELRIAGEGERATAHRLGPDVIAGERPQLVVPQHHWQSAQSLGAWTLVGCTVSPAFEFAGFEMAPDGWEPA